MKRILFGLTILLYIIFVLHLLALYFFWYWQFWWFDIVMHMLGGMWLAGQGMWLYWRWCRHTQKGTHIPMGALFSVSMISVVVFGVLWELFELSIDAYIIFKQNDISDTLSDLGADVAGGLLTFLAFSVYGRIKQ